jgi:hypothetical protein
MSMSSVGTGYPVFVAEMSANADPRSFLTDIKVNTCRQFASPKLSAKIFFGLSNDEHPLIHGQQRFLTGILIVVSHKLTTVVVI